MDDIPLFPAYRPLALADRPAIDALFARFPTELSERTFGSMFAWRRYEARSGLATLNDHLIISWHKPKLGNTVLPPVGPDPASAVLELGRLMRTSGAPISGVFGVLEPDASGLRTAGIQVDSLRDEWDYVYSVDDLTRLEGPNYHTQRKEMKKATAGRNLIFEPMTPEHQEGCLRLEETWCNLKSCTLERFSAAEDLALKEAIANLDKIGFFGGVVLLDGRIEALSVGEPLNTETAVVHFEKANPTIRGLYQVINQQFCEQMLGKFEFVNREQDVGEPGLRRAKEGYHPHHFVEKHVARIV